MDKLFGGGSQGGIIPSKTTPNILIYVDHNSGKKYGYEDGWLAEEDELGPIFEYTGQGTSGDQTFMGQKGSRNAAVLYHADPEKARALHVFVAEGRIPGSKSGAKQQRYIGEFILDVEQPYTVREAHGEHEAQRRIIVFRLRPKGAYERLAKDAITPAQETVTQKVLASVAATRLSEPRMPEVRLVAPKKGRASESRRAAQPSVIAEHRQSDFCELYLKELIAQGHEVFAYTIKIANTTTILKTDLFDATTHELYSVRGESSRDEVRAAIGQLKDYVRHIKPHRPKLTALLPKQPQDDLIDLLHTEGIDLVYQTDNGYTRIPAK